MLDRRAQRAQMMSVVSSSALVVLVALAIAGTRLWLCATMIAGALLPAAILQRLFAGSRLLWIVFVNLAAVYASLFALFTDEVFTSVSAGMLSLGFVLPIACFLIGCWQHRDDIARLIVNPDVRSERGLLGALSWLVPVAFVGIGVLALFRIWQSAIDNDYGFLAAMLLIGLIVLRVSGKVAVFLVDIGLLFEEFFRRAAQMLVPAMAFLTVYWLIVVVFASLYSSIDRYALGPHFRVALEARHLSFAEALYFSIATLSTVGYGDIVPVTSAARILAAGEVVLGVLLLLFGVSEILEYARERRRSVRREKPD